MSSATLFVGDVHGCARELGLLVNLVQPTRLILVGDLFTKGPEPLGVWELIQRWRAESVLGNHDAAVLERWDPDASPIPRAAFDWLQTLPLFLDGPGWRVVHAGVHPTLGPAGTTRDMALNMRRFPDGDESSPNPFWWSLYKGPPLLIYGHDARRGLNDRRPHTLGLDAGCVYGGQLSGYHLEENRLLRVAASKAYKAIKVKP